MNKWIQGTIAGLAMAGAVEGVNAQDMNTVEHQNTQRQHETVQVLSETTTPLEKYNQLMAKIKKVGKTKEEWEKMTDPVALQKLYDIQRPLDDALRDQLKIMKKEGKDVSLLKKEVKRYSTIGMKNTIKGLQQDQLLSQKDKIIAQENEKQVKQETIIRKEKAETAQEKAETAQEKAETAQEKAETAQKDISIQTTKNINNRLSKRKNDIYNPKAKQELIAIIAQYDNIYGKGSYLAQKDLGKQNRKNIQSILNRK